MSSTASMLTPESSEDANKEWRLMHEHASASYNQHLYARYAQALLHEEMRNQISAVAAIKRQEKEVLNQFSSIVRRELQMIL